MKILRQKEEKKISFSSKGRKHSDETKELIRSKRKGQILKPILNFKTAQEIRTMYKETHISQYKLATIFGVTRSCIQSIIENKTWKGVDNRYLLDNPKFNQQIE